MPGSSEASFSADVSRRGASSTANEPPFRRPSSTGTISCSKRPLVDRGERAAVRLERVGVEVLAGDAPTPRRSPRRRCPAGRSASARELRVQPLQPSPPRFDPIGTRDMRLDAGRDDDVEMTGLDRGRRVERGLHRRAALPIDGRAATVSGQPATSGAIRPTFSACSPICVTQPICTSSTSAGSTSMPRR